MKPSLVADAVFDPTCYHRFYDLPPERTAVEVDAVAGWIGAPPRRVLDLACGHGRHAIALAQRGYRVVGVDASDGFLGEARAAAAAVGAHVEWRRGDMRALDERDAFDAVVCLFTAFGYFEDDENLDVLRRVARALAPGGALVIDLMNRDRVLRQLQAQSFVEKDGDVMLDRIAYDEITGRIVNRRTYLVGGRRVEAPFATRAYTLPELRGVLAQAGMRLDGAWGAFDGRPYALDAPRLIVRARRDAG